MKVMLLEHEPVFVYPGSRVIRPRVERSLEMSTAFSCSLPSTTGSERVRPWKFSSSVSPLVSGPGVMVVIGTPCGWSFVREKLS
jgi:hypothetical protein